jgi:lipoate-protein ligase B
VPCGVPTPVTSLAALGINPDMAWVDAALRKSFEGIFGAVSAKACQVP